MTSHHPFGTVEPVRSASKAKAGQRIGVKLVAALLLSCAPTALYAESNADLAREIAELKAQIREMRGAIQSTRSETRRTSARVREATSRGPTIAPPGAPPLAMPVGATPVFVTADKKMQYGALTLTPGGFLAGESLFRSRATQSDMISPFNGIPFPNSVLGNTNEFRFSARQSRVALLAEAAITPTMLASGYMEFDFLGAASTGNENQTNSYTPRIRHLYATLDWNDTGWHVLAGQNWSLVTLNSKGITPRNEVTPTVIDAQQTVGSLYARQPGIRLTKDFNKQLWASISVEQGQITGCPAPNNPAAYTTGTPVSAVGNFGVTCNATGTGGAFVSAQNAGPFYSLDHIPDVIGKVAYEAKLADRNVHFEATGLYTNLYDRAQNLTTGNFSSHNTSGYGVGAGMIVPLIPKSLDFQVNGMYGRGIGRYGAAGLPDSYIDATNGSLHAIRGYVALAGLTLHATPNLDIYGYGGVEGEMRSFTIGAGGATTGIGAPGTLNTSCFIEGPAPAGTGCNGSTRRVYEGTVGFWDKLYTGGFGEVRVGAQYAYIKRDVYEAPGVAGHPATDDHIVMTSFRYFPFAGKAPPPVIAKY